MHEAFVSFHRRPAVVRLAYVLWAALTVAVGLRVALSRPDAGTVVPIYLQAGERWLAGESLYRPILWQDHFRNPPVIAAAFSALKPLPPKVTGLIVRGVGLALFVTGAARLRRTLLAGWSETRVGWLAVLALPLAVPSLNNGQLNLPLAGLALHGVAAAARSRWWEAAAWFGVAGWVKVYPLACGLLVALVAPRTFSAKLAAVVAVGFALPFALDDAAAVRAQYAEYADYLGRDDRTYEHPSRVPRDWTALPRAWLGVVVPPGVAKGVSIAVAVSLALLMLARRRQPLDESLAVALVGSHVWMTAFGPATEMNTYSLLAAAAPLALLTPGLGRPRRVVATVGYALLAATVLRGMFPNDRDFHLLGPQALGAVLVGGAYTLARRASEGRTVVGNV